MPNKKFKPVTAGTRFRSASKSATVSSQKGLGSRGLPSSVAASRTTTAPS